MISDHVYRTCPDKTRGRLGAHGLPRVDPDGCWYLGRCNRPVRDHISVAEYRRQKERS